jgi:hypothetical protein
MLRPCVALAATYVPPYVSSAIAVSVREATQGTGYGTAVVGACDAVAGCWGDEVGSGDTATVALPGVGLRKVLIMAIVITTTITNPSSSLAIS